MKKVVMIVVSILLFLVGIRVEAKDTVYSLNKYQEEDLKYILKSDTQEVSGFVTAGEYSSKKEKHVMLLKYGIKGNKEWEFDYKESSKDELAGLFYSYNQDDQQNGYLLLIKTRKEEKKNYVWIQVGIKGELLKEEETNIPNTVTIEKVLETEDGYLMVGNLEASAYFAKYNKELKEVFAKEYTKDNASQTLTGIAYIPEVGYYGIVHEVTREETKDYLNKYDEYGQYVQTIKDNFEEDSHPQIKSHRDFYIIYGTTKEVKLTNDEDESYYVMKWNSADEEVWETIGNTPVDKDKVFDIQINPKNEEGEEYFILLTNKIDNSMEVIRMDTEGVIREKVKKIKNDYYRIHEFISYQNSIYFVGQINCPEDDNCDYNQNALFLVSDEDKVIEVKDTDSEWILIATGVIVLGTIGLYVYRKYKKKKH